MSETLEITNQKIIGINSHGYRFGVLQMKGSDDWHGFAFGGKTIFLLPGCSNIKDRDECIKRVGAVVNNPEHGYDGIGSWLVGENLRGKPGDFICEHCGNDCCEDDYCTIDYGDIL